MGVGHSHSLSPDLFETQFSHVYKMMYPFGVHSLLRIKFEHDVALPPCRSFAILFEIRPHQCGCLWPSFSYGAFGPATVEH